MFLNLPVQTLHGSLLISDLSRRSTDEDETASDTEVRTPIILDKLSKDFEPIARDQRRESDVFLVKLASRTVKEWDNLARAH